MSKYYIIPEYIRSECYEFNKGLFKFICNQDVSTNDFKQYFDQYPERSNIMHMIYYISQYTQDDSDGFDDWYQFVYNQLDTISSSVNYTFSNYHEKELISLAIAIKTIDQSKYNILDLEKYFTYEFCNYIINTKYIDLNEKIYSLYIVSCKIIDCFGLINYKDYKMFLKIIKLRNSLMDQYIKIIDDQYKIMHGENKDE